MLILAGVIFLSHKQFFVFLLLLLVLLSLY